MGIISGKRPGPRRTLLYAEHGVGKSSWAAGSPNPLFLDVEQGTNDLDVARWDEAIYSYHQLIAILEWVRTQEHSFHTLVLDTLDWTEKLIFKDITTAAGVATVNDIDFGKGPPRAIPKWDLLLSQLATIQAQRRMGIVLLSHARLEKVTPPDAPAYDRYSPDLWTNAKNEGAASIIQEWCDEVFFVRKKRIVRTEGKGLNERGMIIGTEEREMLTSDSGFARAKNRLNMPSVVAVPRESPWSEYRKYIVANKPPKPAEQIGSADIGGLVVEGSSKPQPPEVQEGMKELAEAF